MATLSVKQQVISEANTIHQDLQVALELISRMSPTDQVLNGNQLMPMGDQLKALQERVQATYLSRAGAIAEISQPELEELASRLAMSAEILESIEQGTAIAATITEIENEIDTLYDPKPEAISALQVRMRGLLNTHQFLNPGARAAITSLDHSLKVMASEAASPALQPHSLPPQPSSPETLPRRQAISRPFEDLRGSPPPLPSSPETLPQAPRRIQRQAERAADVAERTLRPRPPSPATPPLRSPDLRQPRAEESRPVDEDADENKIAEYYVRLAQMVGQNGKILPDQLFDKVVEFYNEISSTRSPAFQEDYGYLLSDAQTLLLNIIKNQRDIESREPEKRSLLILGAIETAVKKAIDAQKRNEKASVEEFLLAISNAYEGLDLQTKTMLAEANEAVLQKAGQATIARTLFVSFGSWPGSWEQKMEAVRFVQQKLQTPAQRSPLSSPALHQFKDEMIRLIASNAPSDLLPIHEKLVNQAWTALNTEEKAEVERSLREVLQGKFRDTLKRFPFSQWSGSWKEKLRAVKMLLTPSEFFFPGRAAPKTSELMARRFEELCQVQIILSDSVVAVVTSTPGGPVVELKAGHIFPATPDVQTQPSHPYGRVFTEVISMYHWIEAFPKLIEIGSLLEKQSLKDALEILKDLEEKKLTSTFKISDQSQRPIDGRLYYHLYYIHKNASPKLLKDDPEYGRKAFRGDYPAQNSERLRAITRTIAEVMLETLEDMINFEQTGTEAMEYLLALMDSTLDDADKVDGQTNVAGMLYAAFHQLHASARSRDPALDDPAEPKYKGDFGKTAFNQTGPGIDPSLKVKAIEQVREKMKAAWKLQ